MAVAFIASFFDVKCCAMRDRDDFDFDRCTGRSTSNQFPDPEEQRRPPLTGRSHQDSTHCHKFDPALDCQPMHSSRHVRRDLIDKLASMLHKSPYIAREIHERSTRSLRFKFLRYCALCRYEECETVWDHLSEQERLDFMQMAHLGKCKLDAFFLNITEPDANTWVYDGSENSLSEFDIRSDSGSSVSGGYRAPRSECSSSSEYGRH